MTGRDVFEYRMSKTKAKANNQDRQGRATSNHLSSHKYKDRRVRPKHVNREPRKVPVSRTATLNTILRKIDSSKPRPRRFVLELSSRSTTVLEDPIPGDRSNEGRENTEVLTRTGSLSSRWRSGTDALLTEGIVQLLIVKGPHEFRVLSGSSRRVQRLDTASRSQLITPTETRTRTG